MELSQKPTFETRYREVKFTRALRVQFSLIFQKKVLPLSYWQWHPESDPYIYMINPSIESSTFLLWHEKDNWFQILKILWGNRQAKFHEFKLRVCVRPFLLNTAFFFYALKSSVFFKISRRKKHWRFQGVKNRQI